MRHRCRCENVVGPFFLHRREHFATDTTNDNSTAANDTHPTPSTSSPVNEYGHDPEDIRRALEEVEAELAPLEKEPLNNQYRGGALYRRILQERKNNVVTRKEASSALHQLVFKRHALQHGAMKLGEMDRKELTKSFLGNNVDFDVDREDDYDEPSILIPRGDVKVILRQMWRFGPHGSEKLARYQKLYAEKKKKKQEEDDRIRAEMSNKEDSSSATISKEQDDSIMPSGGDNDGDSEDKMPPLVEKDSTEEEVAEVEEEEEGNQKGWLQRLIASSRRKSKQ